MRPIVSARNTIFSGLTKEMGRILSPMVGNTQHHLRDSNDLKDKLKDVNIPPTHRLYSFDLVYMFTNIPSREAIDLAGERLHADTKLKDRTPIKPDDVIALLKLDIELAYFRYGGEFYSQPRGLGMGKSTSSPLSDIFMEDFEQKALASFPHRDSILFWLRKADDPMVAIHQDHADALFNHINSIHPDINWTKEEEENGLIHMLDVNIQRNPDGSLSTDVYRKPTHTNQYIHFHSHAPLQHKLATVRSLTRRAQLIPSTPATNIEEERRAHDIYSEDEGNMNGILTVISMVWDTRFANGSMKH